MKRLLLAGFIFGVAGFLTVVRAAPSSSANAGDPKLKPAFACVNALARAPQNPPFAAMMDPEHVMGLAATRFGLFWVILAFDENEALRCQIHSAMELCFRQGGAACPAGDFALAGPGLRGRVVSFDGKDIDNIMHIKRLLEVPQILPKGLVNRKGELNGVTAASKYPRMGTPCTADRGAQTHSAIRRALTEQVTALREQFDRHQEPGKRNYAGAEPYLAAAAACAPAVGDEIVALVRAKFGDLPGAPANGPTDPTSAR